MSSANTSSDFDALLDELPRNFPTRHAEILRFVYLNEGDEDTCLPESDAVWLVEVCRQVADTLNKKTRREHHLSAIINATYELVETGALTTEKYRPEPHNAGYVGVRLTSEYRPDTQ